MPTDAAKSLCEIMIDPPPSELKRGTLIPVLPFSRGARGDLSAIRQRSQLTLGVERDCLRYSKFDEPTNDLDPQRRKLVWDILREINREQRTTIILITHDAIEAEKPIQRVGILHADELVALSRPSELKRQVDRMLRLELFFSPETPPTLPPNLTR